VAEEIDGGDAGGQASGKLGPDSAAIALALGSATKARADAYLDEQIELVREQKALTRLQTKELSHELGLRHWSLWVRHASGVLKLALELSAGLILLFAVTAIGVMVWNAAHSDGLVIESFSVPPDLAEKGITGQVVATRMLDQLTAMQNVTTSLRAPKSYANNWGDDIKVEIPETGVSIGEAYRFLRRWLGHETHVGGEITRTATGLAVTAREGGESGVTFTGGDSELDALVLKAAEQIYRASQPYRYGVYLNNQGRSAEMATVFQGLTRAASASERGWAYIGLASFRDDDPAMRRYDYQRAVEADPDDAAAVGYLANTYNNFGSPEQGLPLVRRALALMAGAGHGQIRADWIASQTQNLQSSIDYFLGAYRDSALVFIEFIQSGHLTGVGQVGTLATRQAMAHELDAAAATLADPLPDLPGTVDGNALATGEARMTIAFMAEDWNGVLRQEAALQPLFLRRPSIRSQYHLRRETLAALALAKLGRFAEAEQRVRDTPADCYLCLRARAQIAEMEGRHERADWWFARAVAGNPSIPMAYAEWGQAFLARGKPDDAIAQFSLANKKGPHFADPLEGWGEALMAKNQSHLALAKFAEAEKYAPNWGRLHLKWGEALIYAGKRAEAKAQFARAAALDLTPPEKAELTRADHG